MLKLRPGFLVTLSTRLEGGVHYRVLGKEVLALPAGGELANWTTERSIADRTEHKAATNVRLHIRSLVRSVCAETPFGLICPADEEAKLDQKIAEAHQLAADWNAKAKHHKVQFSTLRGKIAESQSEAVQAITAEVKALLESLDQVTRAGDVKGIRDVAMRATQMERLLEQGTSVRDAVGRAVFAARKVARQVVRKVEQQGEALEAVLSAANLSPIAQARFVLDTPEATWEDVPAAVGGPADPEQPVELPEEASPHFTPESIAGEPGDVGLHVTRTVIDDPEPAALRGSEDALPLVNRARFAAAQPLCPGCGSEYVTVHGGTITCEDCCSVHPFYPTPATAPEEVPA